MKTDRFLTDPRACHFDPNVLQCTSSNFGSACLSAEQVTTMTNYYAGVIDPRTGKVINPGFARGNETDDISVGGLAFQERLPEPLFDGLFYWVFGPSFGYAVSATNYKNFDFHDDVDKVDALLAEPLNADSTDLSGFEQLGNKLIMYHGWADPVIPSQSSIDYFNALVGQNNLGQTQEYARLFVADTPPTVEMTRPLCVFPNVAKYKGSGNTNDWTNFACVAEQPNFNETPASKYGP